VNELFADTFYYLALVNRNNADHERAVAMSESLDVTTVTTAWVLNELADAMASPSQRPAFLRLLEAIRTNPHCVVVPPGERLFDEGLGLYAERADKHWSLTDCISFVVMRERGLTEALTGDHHFAQAGFTARFLDGPAAS
jgi:predicted nucleic acid-binding protein